MAIKELDAGQRHIFAPSALRVQLTGPVHGEGVLLQALDQAGGESVTVRLSDVEVVLTPQPRRLRLVATPKAGGWFPAGTSIGVTLRTEGASSAAEQILVSQFDAGALSTFEIAVLEFAPDRAVLTVSGSGQQLPASTSAEQQQFTSGSVFQGSSATAGSTPATTGGARGSAGPPAALGDGDDLPWLQPGRYALRDAAKLGTPDAPVSAWGIVLDGSASMHDLHHSGQVDALVGLVCGAYVHWTKTWASASVLAGVRVTDFAEATTDPTELFKAGFVDAEPSSWSSVAEGAALVAGRVGAQGAVLIVTDGVPGDIARLAEVAAANPGVRFSIITSGVSRYSLSSDGQHDWWREELAGLEPIDSLPNISAVAVRQAPDGRLELSGTRAAELALRVTAPLGERMNA